MSYGIMEYRKIIAYNVMNEEELREKYEDQAVGDSTQQGALSGLKWGLIAGVGLMVAVGAMAAMGFAANPLTWIGIGSVAGLSNVVTLAGIAKLAVGVVGGGALLGTTLGGISGYVDGSRNKETIAQEKIQTARRNEEMAKLHAMHGMQMNMRLGQQYGQYNASMPGGGYAGPALPSQPDGRGQTLSG